MVQIAQKYTDAELKSKASSFYCGEGWVKVQIVNSAKVPNPYKKEGEDKPDVIAIYYDVIEGEFQGVGGHVNLEVFDDSLVEYKNGGSEPRSKKAHKQLYEISIAAGNQQTVYETTLLHSKIIQIFHKLNIGKPKKDEAGDYTGENYPDSSDPRKFRKCMDGIAAQAAAIYPPTKLQAAPVAAPIAAPAGLYPPASQPVAAQPAQPQPDIDYDEIPF